MDSNPLHGDSLQLAHLDVSVDSSGAALHRDGDEDGINKNYDGVENNCEIVYGDEYAGALTTAEEEEAVGVGGRRKKKRFRGPKQWKNEWVETYPWATVRVVRGEERMFCTICEAHGSTATRNAFRKEGSTNYQPSALATHADSSAHKNALQTQRFWIDAEQVTAFSSVTKQLAPKKLGGPAAAIGQSGTTEMPTGNLHKALQLLYQTMQTNHNSVVDQLTKLGQRMTTLETSFTDLRTDLCTPRYDRDPSDHQGDGNIRK
ncbi:unnamed protein product [Sphagnum jensenii]|uniref:C17orf113 probable zinc finger domain-containing protein n=1 Tax=Sphagnum jensenii TaxID=128206 RepID=A0ABP0WFS1_9BRYO